MRNVKPNARMWRLISSSDTGGLTRSASDPIERESPKMRAARVSVRGPGSALIALDIGGQGSPTRSELDRCLSVAPTATHRLWIQPDPDSSHVPESEADPEGFAISPRRQVNVRRTCGPIEARRERRKVVASQPEGVYTSS